MPSSQKSYDVLSLVIVMSMTLTFFHPVLWLLVGAVAGLAVLYIGMHLSALDSREPPSLVVALLWMTAILVIGFVYGGQNEFYNAPHLAFLALGILFGYFLSIRPVSELVAWIPFLIFAAYFLAMMAIGQVAEDALTRNSRNYVSVIMIALYCSSILLSRPIQLHVRHVIFAYLTLIISVWGSGRAGILASALLAAGLSAHCLLFKKMGTLRLLLTSVILILIGLTTWSAIQLLLNNGYLTRLTERGLQDASRLAILVAYFTETTPQEFVFGKNYYDDAFLAQRDFNLHNSYVSAWAHLSILYPILLITTLILAARRLGTVPALSLALLAFGLRAVTDIQMLAGKYDYVFIGALFVMLRSPLIDRTNVLRPSSQS